MLRKRLEKNKMYNLMCFLQDNRQYNKEFQKKWYKKIILREENQFDKIISLVYHVANTQSRPPIDDLSKLYKKLYQLRNDLNTFEGFMRAIENGKRSEIEENEEHIFDSLFKRMRNQNGYGDKTAALIVKHLIHIHSGKYDDKNCILAIWNDFPKEINENDRLYLPVDEVIKFVFNKMNLTKGNDFWGINNYLSEKEYSNTDIEVLDDIWFWGFITQEGSGEERKLKFNENKYWSQRETNKDKKVIQEIMEKASKFIDLCK